MRKYILFIILILVGIINLFPQSTLSESYKWNLPQTVPSTPQSQIFEKYVNHKVSECNGLPDISIPLGEISVKGLTIPIVLSYHASGVKYMQYDGDVGAGWSISAGGYRISRNINGKCDFSYLNGRHYYTEQELLEEQNYLIKDRYLGQLALYQQKYGGLGGVMSNPDSNIEQLPAFDGEYDLFTFNTPTANGHFIMPNAMGNNNGIILEDQLAKVFMNRNTGQLIDDKGNTFLFGLNQNIEKMLIQGDTQREVGWPLNRITTPFNDIIDFEYVKHTSRAQRDKTLPFDYSLSDASLISALICFGKTGDPASTSSDGDVKRRGDSGFDITETYYITQIKTDNIIVKFNRENKETTSGNSPCLITSVEIVDRISGYTKKIHFSYKTLSYSSGKYWHYLLNSITISDGQGNMKGENYNFEYYEPQFSYSTVYLYPDQWGFYKQGSGEQAISLHSEFGSDQYIEYADQNSNRMRYKNMSNNNQYSKFVANRTQSGIPEAFSLKKITYPTGGYTEYVYESNKYDNYIGGGIRIKTIISKTPADNNSKPIISAYRYKNGVPAFPLNESNFRSYSANITLRTIGLSTEAINQFIYGQNRLYSMYPTGDVPMGDFKVHYGNVEVEQYTISGVDTIKNGRTDYEFMISKRYTTEPMLSGSGDFPLLFANYSQYKPNNSGVYVAEYALAYAPFYLKSKIFFNRNNKLLKSEHYEYVEAPNPISYKGIKVSQKVFIEGHVTQEKDYPKRLSATYGMPHICLQGDRDFFLQTGPFYAYNYIRSFFGYKYYYIKTNKLLPKAKIIKEYSSDEQNPFTTTESYEYDAMNRLKKTMQSSNTNGNLIREVTYPQINTVLSNKNMLSTIVETVTTHNNKEIGRILHNYLESILPANTQTSASGINSLRTDIVYNQYDTKGNILQYTTIDGISTSYLWSYNYRYPVAEIVNATYSEVTAALGINTTSLATNSSPDVATLNKINTLRTSLPNALITTYTYKPLVGMLTATDPSGIITYYTYDSFGRLKEAYIYKDNIVSAANKQVVQSYDYHYQTNK